MEEHNEKMLLEILRMARELVINEHTDRRAQLHNSWLYESEQLWKTRRMKLKYPDIPPYPTEQDVLERAQKLLKFLVLGDVTNTDILPTKVEEITETEPIIEETTEPIIEEKNEPKSIKEEPAGRILPQVLKQIEKMRNKF